MFSQNGPCYPPPPTQRDPSAKLARLHEWLAARAMRLSRLQRLGAASATALGSGAAAHLSSAAELPHDDALAQLRKQADKARQRAQERVRLGESEMLGMTPKLWLEALDEEHRHGSSLHQYWQRWEASRTRTTSMSEVRPRARHSSPLCLWCDDAAQRPCEGLGTGTCAYRSWHDSCRF